MKTRMNPCILLVLAFAGLLPLEAFAGTRSRCENELSEGGWTVSMSRKFGEAETAALLACFYVTGPAGLLGCIGDVLYDIAAEVGWDMLEKSIRNKGHVVFGPGDLQVQAGVCSKTYPIVSGVKGMDRYVYVRYRRTQSQPPSNLAPGFYRATSDPHVYLVLGTGNYCWVPNGDQMNAYGGFAQVQEYPSLHIQGNYTGACGWPNGFFRQSDRPEVYRMYGSTLPGFDLGDRYCHVVSEAQLAAFGATGKVQVVEPSSDLGRGRTYKGGCKNP